MSSLDRGEMKAGEEVDDKRGKEQQNGVPQAGKVVVECHDYAVEK